MRKLAIGLVTLALAGAVGCGKNNEDNNDNNTNNTENNTQGVNNSNNTTGNNTTGNNTTGNNTTGTNNTTGNNTTGTNNMTGGTNNMTGGTNNMTGGTNNMTGGTNNTNGPSAKCTQYCGIVLANCTGANEVFADEATCLTACEGYASDDTVDCTTPGDCAAESEGVECRIYHGDVAAGDPETHCPHASEDGGGVCG